MRFGAKKQNKFNNKFKNKSIIVIALILSFSSIIAGLLGLKANQFPIFIIWINPIIRTHTSKRVLINIKLLLDHLPDAHHRVDIAPPSNVTYFYTNG